MSLTFEKVEPDDQDGVQSPLSDTELIASIREGIRTADPDDYRFMESGKCLGLDTELFFPKKGQHQDRKAAEDTCRDCPVRIPCLISALVNNEKEGVRGGMSQNVRVKFRRVVLRGLDS